MRALVLESHLGMREVVRLVCAESGFEVACAPDGAQAIELARGGPCPTVVLLDLDDVEGRTFFHWLRAQSEPLASVAVIALPGLSPGDAELAGSVALPEPFEARALFELLGLLDAHSWRSASMGSSLAALFAG